MRRIDIFIMKNYATYCDEKSRYGELQDQKSFTDYVESNKPFLIQEYKAYRRANRDITTMSSLIDKVIIKLKDDRGL